MGKALHNKSEECLQKFSLNEKFEVTHQTTWPNFTIWHTQWLLSITVSFHT